MTENTVELDLSDNQKNIIEVTLGHLANEEEMNDPEAAEDFREIINLVRSEEPITELDCHTVWVVLDKKQGIDFPAQPYDENVAAEGAKEKIEDAVGEIPEHYKED